jgi:hypothetical protein
MIDWWSVVSNSFWIVGLAMLLAALSYAYWAGAEEKTTFRQQIEKSWFLRVSAVAFVLIGLGLAGTSHTVWEIALSAMLIICSVVFFLALRNNRVYRK